MLQDCYQDDVKEALKELPKDLDETYARMLRKIPPTASRDRVIRLLECLSVANRPLRVEELVEVFALDFRPEGAPPVLKDHKPLEDLRRVVVSICSSLILIVGNDDSGVIQFSHFSVKEFLTSDRLAEEYKDISQFHIKDEPAHTTLARACLGALLRLDDSLGLKEYASQHWVKHAQFGTVSSRIAIEMRPLFDSTKPYFAAWLKLHDIDDIDDRWWDKIYNDVDSSDLPRSSRNSADSDNPPDFDSLGLGPDFYNSAQSVSDADHVSPLYYASLCGFCDLAAHVIDEHQEQVNARGGHYHFPLVAALYNGHDDVVELLRQHGADANAALQVASADGRSDVVQRLLNHGADPNVQQDDYQSPIDLAVVGRHEEVVRTLLGHRDCVCIIPCILISCTNHPSCVSETDKMTKKDFLARPLMAQLDKCESRADVFTLLRTQIQDFKPSTSGDDNMTRWVDPTIMVFNFAPSDDVLVKICSADSTIYDL